MELIITYWYVLNFSNIIYLLLSHASFFIVTIPNSDALITVYDIRFIYMCVRVNEK